MGGASTVVWLPLSASAAVGAAVGAEFPVFPVVVESENTRVQNQAMALNGIIAKNTHRIRPLNSFLSKSINLKLKSTDGRLVQKSILSGQGKILRVRLIKVITVCA